MDIIETIVSKTVDYKKGGVVPDWTKTLIRFLVAAMWLSHEVHALFWGRGDGEDGSQDVHVIQQDGLDLESSGKYFY